MTECPHGLEADWCSLCKHGPEKKERVYVIAVFTVKFSGLQCPECNLPIMVGQRAVKMSDDRYLHELCEDGLL